MAGTKEGGRAAAATNKAKYGPDYYSKIGKKGGNKSRTGGFAAMDPERLRAVSRLGGQNSSRKRQNG